MTARIIDGKALAATVRAEVKAGVDALRTELGRIPGLDVVLVGSDPGSVVYTRNKEKASLEVGMRGRLHVLPAATPEEKLVAMVRELNADPAVDGILVQLPLPKHINALRVLDLIEVGKDVDGFHPSNAGLLSLGRPGGLVACTPAGCMRLIATTGVPVEGANAVVVGRSNTVGKPMAQLLLAANATVTIAHSKTRDLAAVCRQPGAVVIDVGTNRVPLPDGKAKLYGDVAFDEAKEVAGAITPVPGGVGPMTIACLLANTVRAACTLSGLPAPAL